MRTFRRFGQWNWVLFACLGGLLLLPATSSSADRGALERTKSPAGVRSELSDLAIVKMAARRPQLHPRPESVRVGIDLGQLSGRERGNPRALFLQNGSFLSTRPLHAQISERAPGLAKLGLVRPGDAASITHEQGLSKRPYIVQLRAESLKGAKAGRTMRALEAGGARILASQPRNAFIVRIPSFAALQQLKAHRDVVHIEEYYPAFTISRHLGHERVLNPARAARNVLDLRVTLFPGEHGQPFKKLVNSLGGDLLALYRGGPRSFDTAIIDGLPPQAVYRLAQHARVRTITAQQVFLPLTTTTPGVVQAGHFLENLTPMFRLGVDGSTQFVAVTDDGVSLDSTPFAHSLTQPDLNPGNDTDTTVAPDVGASHRKVESYRTAREINLSVGRDGSGPRPAPGAGDFLTCDSPLQGSSTHGQLVASLAVGNPSFGPDGLGITRDNIFAFFGFAQTDLAFDGVARGARLIFQDSHDTPTSPIGCFFIGQSDVDLGGSGTNTVGGIDFGSLRALLHEAAFRLDLGGDPTDPANWVPHPRGARVHVLPFGVPNFDDNLINGHNQYAGTISEDVDDFVFRNRESLVVVPAGNDGSGRTESIGIGGTDVFPDPNDAATYQITVPGTAKNALVMGSHVQSATTFSTSDEVENPFDYTSKGPATFLSRRVAPLLMAPGGEVGTNADYSAPGYISMVAFRSNDNDQAGPIAEQTDFDGNPTDYIDESNAGTSFAAAAAGGAAALVRDYFAKGFYPSGSQDPGAQHPATSAALVKAILIASANYEDLDLKEAPGTVASLERFSNVQGYGRIEIVSSLPMATYPEALLPDERNHGQVPGIPPTTPLGALAVDEYFDGGQGLGVITSGETKTYTINIIDSSRELRVALAYADPVNEQLVHDLDLVLASPVFVDTDGLPDASLDDAGCAGGGCTRLAYNGNQFLGPFSVDTRVSSGAAFAQACDPTVIGRDVCNPTEAVFLTSARFNSEDVGFQAGVQNDGDGICEPGEDCILISDLLGQPTLNIGPSDTGTDFVVSFLGEGDGVLNSESNGGLNSAICVAFASTNPDVNFLCTSATDFNGNGSTTDSEDSNGDGRLDTLTGIPTGTWEIRVTANSVTIPVPNAPTIVPDTLKTPDTVDSPATGSAYAANTTPFALFAAGGFLSAGAARAAFERSEFDCADATTLQVIDSDPGASAASVSAGTTVEVLRPGIGPVDSETNIHFEPDASVAGAFRSREVSVQRAVGAAIAGNGILEVKDGDLLQVTYAGASGQAAINCAPVLIAQPFGLFGPDKTALVSGGCDNDSSFDAGETVLYQVNLNNISEKLLEHQEVEVSLVCTNPPGTESADPCQYIVIQNSPLKIGRLLSVLGVEFIQGQGPTFSIFVKQNVRDLDPADRLIDLNVTVAGGTRDVNATDDEPVVLTFRHALESDLETFHYSTDYPDGTGGAFVLRDLDRDGSIRPPITPRLSEPGVGQLISGDLAGSVIFAFSELAQETQKFDSLFATGTNVRDTTIEGEAPEEEIFDPPFDFDAPGDAATEGFFARRNPLSRQGSIPGSVEWHHSQSGVCGFQTLQSDVQGIRAGVWHAGGNIEGVAFDGVCPPYGLPSTDDGIQGNAFINDTLFTPVIHKVNQAPDPLGFDFSARITRLAWNEQVGLNSDNMNLLVHIDNNLDLDGNTNLDSAGFLPPILDLYYSAYTIGPINQTNDLTVNSKLQTTFGPLFDPDGSTSVTGGGTTQELTGEEVGVARPLREADTIISRFLLPFPARDSDPSTPGVFDSAPDDRSTPAGPVRNRESAFDTFAPIVPAIEDFMGPTGNRFQAAMTWWVQEDDLNQPGHGWTIDDLVIEWDETHPVPLGSIAGTSCERIGSTEDANGNGILDPGEDVGLDGIAGTGDFGEGNGIIDSNGAGAQCASLAVDRTSIFDCDTTLDVTVQDLTPPDIYNAGTNTFCRDADTGTFLSPCDGEPDGFVVINARTFSEPRGEEFILPAVEGQPTLFRAQIPVSTTLNVNVPVEDSIVDPLTLEIAENQGNVFVRPAGDTGINPAPLTVTYQDLDCDGDADGVLDEANFRDIDGDGVTNFDNNFDSFPDDNCFIAGGDTSNPDQANDAFGQTVDAIDPSDGSVIATDIFVGEYIDADLSKTYTPIEDAFFGAGDSRSFNGLLDPGEDVGVNLLSDADEAAIAAAACPEFLVEGTDRRSELGPDCAPGTLGVDDNKDFVVDNAEELGWCGTDDRLGDNFSTDPFPSPYFSAIEVTLAACPSGTENDDNLQGDVAHSPDTFGDLCDNCPLFFNPNQLDDDADGVGNECEDEDLDDDGVPNVGDNCPTVFNPDQLDDDTDGRGDACDKVGGGPDPDQDGDTIADQLDNCPAVKNGICDNPMVQEPCTLDADCSAANHVCTPIGICQDADNIAACDVNNDGSLDCGADGICGTADAGDEVVAGFQRDSDFDAIGDACDPEDFDMDADPDSPTFGQVRPDGVPNFRDNCPTIYNPRNAEGVQEDTDGDGLGDERASTGFVGCDPDSTDDDNDGNPDDLVSFGLAVTCNTKVGGNLGAVSLRGVSTVDDPTDPRGQGTLGDGDTIADPGERINLFVTLFNGTPNDLTNARIGLGSTSDSVACVVRGEIDFGTIPAGAVVTNTEPFVVVITDDLAAQLDETKPIGEVLREPKRAVFTVSAKADELLGTLSLQTFALNLDLDLQGLTDDPPFTYFESFENVDENSPADERDQIANGGNGNGKIDCGPDNDCDTVTPCPGTGLTCPDGSSPCCDEWTIPMTADADLRLVVESRTGTTFPDTRGEARVVAPGSKNVCPADAGGDEPGGVRPDALDWHIHTSATPDIEGTDTTTLSSTGKAYHGKNSLHWGRHIVVPNVSEFTLGDGYCLQCINAFILDREGGLNLNSAATEEQPLRLSFWHIMEMCDHECFSGFVTQTADEFAIVEVRSDLDFGAGTKFGPWERIEPSINPYDGVQDTLYFTPSYEPPDDINPLATEDKETTMCSPLFSYIAQGSAKGLDAVNCTDGDNNGFNDCGWVAARTNPAERRPDRIARGSEGVGVWVFTSFPLDRYAGRHIQARFISSTLDGRDVFTSYLETTSGPFYPPSASYEDGWYIDDVRISGLIPNELVFSVDTTDGDGTNSATCPAPSAGGGSEPLCTVTGADVVASPANSGAPGATVLLTAVGAVSNCISGESQVRWLRDGVEVRTFSTDRTLVDAPLSETTYTAEIRCSSLPSCSATGETTVHVYDGATSSSIDLRWLPNPGELVFNAVNQLDLQGPGLFPGYDVYCGLVRPGTAPVPECSGAGLTASAPGSGIASNYGNCFAPDLAQQAPGTQITVPNANLVEPDAGEVLFYVAGHGFPTPVNLGFTANNKLRQASVSCP